MSEKITVDKAEWDRLKEIEQEHNLVTVRNLKVGDEIFMPNQYGPGKWITIKDIGELSDRVHLTCDDYIRFHSVRYGNKFKVRLNIKDK